MLQLRSVYICLNAIQFHYIQITVNIFIQKKRVIQNILS